MRSLLFTITVAAITTPAFAQVPSDYRIRANFRTSTSAPWGANVSVGHAECRVISRFGKIYYGGVFRSDEFKFKVQFDYRVISGFASSFASSPFNTDYDLYINAGFVGRVHQSTTVPGLAELIYDSRHPTLPELLLPAGFPEVVNIFDIVTVFPAAGAEPEIGDPTPAGVPMFQSELVESFARGDANQDGKVDEDDYAILASSYDPFGLLGEHVGPMAGDFTGDNLADRSDYDTLVANWTDSHAVPGEPAPVALPCFADTNNDGFVDSGDISAFVAFFLGENLAADFNNDGFIDSGDIAAFVEAFLAGC